MTPRTSLSSQVRGLQVIDEPPMHTLYLDKEPKKNIVWKDTK